MKEYIDSTDPQWPSLSHKEKNHQLFLKQKTMLAMFLERGAITRAQHDKSLHDLREKMGKTDQATIIPNFHEHKKAPSVFSEGALCYPYLVDAR